MSALRTIFGEPAVVRAHNLLTSGSGRGLPHWSSGNVYHEDDRGRPLTTGAKSTRSLTCGSRTTWSRS